MRIWQSIILLALTIAITIVAYVSWLWRDANVIISQSELAVTFSGKAISPMSVTERVIAFNEYKRTWNIDDRPCATLIALWSDLFSSNETPIGATVSYSVTRMIFNRQDYSLKTGVTEFLISCQLDRSFENLSLLRHTLKYAYFGRREYGIEIAARSMFNKAANELSVSEAAQLAILLRAPSLRKQPDTLMARAATLEKQFNLHTIK